MQPATTTPDVAPLPLASVGLSAPPRLENGDRLQRGEFERRYAAMPRTNKAELIEGVVYMPSPVSLVGHAEPHARIVGWLLQYCAFAPYVRIGDNATLRLDDDNEPQPDAVLFRDAAHGGGARVAADGFLEGVPELVVEVSSSSVSIDMHDKLRAYQRNGIPEYLTWRVQDGAIDWFELRDGKYVPIEPDADGLLRSRQFPGLWLDRVALLRGDLASVLKAVQRGVEQRPTTTPES